MHDLVIVGVPLFVILAGILLNRADFRRLEDKMDRRFEALRAEMDSRFNTLRAEMNGRFDLVDAELRYFHKQEGKHEARLDQLEKKCPVLPATFAIKPDLQSPPCIQQLAQPEQA